MTITQVETVITPDINDAGTVVYRAHTNLGTGYVFAGQQAILGPGTILDGITLSSGIDAAINNLGQIAIRVAYTGGSGIVLATPDPIPEPSAVFLLVMGTITVLACRRVDLRMSTLRLWQR